MKYQTVHRFVQKDTNTSCFNTDQAYETDINWNSARIFHYNMVRGFRISFPH